MTDSQTYSGPPRPATNRLRPSGEHAQGRSPVPDAVNPEPTQTSLDPHGVANLRFTGSGWEYFRIWVANTALTLLTLGVFSAWATVRTRRYFYGNTWFGDSAFNYTARPLTVLIGRLIVVAVLIALWLAQAVSLTYYFLGFLLLFPLYPWIAIRGRSFRLGNSYYRHVCWDFQGDYATAAKYYCLGPVVGLLSLGLMVPYIAMRRDLFLIQNSRFGTAECVFQGTVGEYYGIYFISVVVFLVGLLAEFLLGLVVPDIGFALGVIGWIPVLMAGVYFTVSLDNLRWSRTEFGGYQFKLELSFWVMLGLYLSNLFLVAVTLGAFIPFAKVRVIRYKVRKFSITRQGTEPFFAGPRQTIGAAGAEAGDSFGLDLGV